MKSFSAFITEKKKPEKPQGVNQADVSKDAANYRRAQRQRNATGGPTTGRTGKKSFPGDRSGAYAKAKADLEARKGFSGSKSGGLKADEANPNVNRAVRQQRSVKQGVSVHGHLVLRHRVIHWKVLEQEINQQHPIHLKVIVVFLN